MAQVNETRRGTLHRPVDTFLGKEMCKISYFLNVLGVIRSDGGIEQRSLGNFASINDPSTTTEKLSMQPLYKEFMKLELLNYGNLISNNFGTANREPEKSLSGYQSDPSMAGDLNRDLGLGEAGSQRPKHRPPVPSKPNVQSAALLGASLAFGAQGMNTVTTPRSANGTRHPRTLAMMDLGTLDGEPMQQDTAVRSSTGLVGVRIKQFNETQGSTLSQTVSSLHPEPVGPQQIAAQLAVGKSTVRPPPAIPSKGNRAVNSPARQNDPKQGPNHETSASSVLSHVARSNGVHDQQDSAAKGVSSLVTDTTRPFTDPLGHRDVVSNGSVGPQRKEHTGPSLLSSSLGKAVLQLPQPELQKNTSLSQGNQGPPLPPRPMVPVNTSHASQQTVPAKNVIRKNDPAIDNKLNVSRIGGPMSIRTTIPNARDPRSQMLPSRSSSSSLRPQHSGLSESSPTKGMRQTLRQETKSDHNETKRRRKFQRPRIIKTHPNKHREGDRKRWRDRITERERKRYEGVWAANRGLLIDENSPPGSSTTPLREMVLNLVVRDIWSRSRLQPILLGQIWDLVCHDNRRMLTRQEFVVGMWLIDQSLKGRKLPIRVSQSVWDSVHIPDGMGGFRKSGPTRGQPPPGPPEPLAATLAEQTPKGDVGVC
ncbi:increased rDNA silencing protein [Histoplasma capsulatum]|uniref:Increased rDNA silencing protein n=1 Tax=Ajellomyces capsulatus TaxID=5037 RepID=A0A8A1MLT9_AJECA|nr:increased rDNA silencing protein [Histoplasma capsulatum]